MEEVTASSSRGVGPATAKGDQKRPKGDQKRTKGPVGSHVRVGEGSFHRGQRAGWAQCVCWAVCYLGRKQGLSAPHARAVLLPCKFCIGRGGQRWCGMGLVRGSLLVPWMHGWGLCYKTPHSLKDLRSQTYIQQPSERDAVLCCHATMAYYGLKVVFNLWTFLKGPNTPGC